MLNEAPNNNDVKHVENNVLNEAPNSNGATRAEHVSINVRLIAMGEQQFSMATYQRRDDTITGKVRADGNKLCPGKEWRLYTQ